MIILKTNYGTIKIKLDFENTPNTAENFARYVREGFYNNTLFHRVIDGFMIQGGGFEAATDDTGMNEKIGFDPIENEAEHAKSNTRGTIAMARTSFPHSASSQFFINVADNKFLDFASKTPDGWGYCVFGEVIEGMEVVDKIKKVPTSFSGGHDDVPVENVIIETAVEEVTEEASAD